MLYRNYIKAWLDISLGLLCFLVILPVFVCVTVLLLVSNKGNPFFFQKRPGKNGRVFTVIKFKTMSELKDAKGKLLSDEERLTAIGKFTRRTSLDEIPQLLNVIKGDMSFVGPRPLLVEYMNLYNEVQNRRHLVKPGITGLAQVNGRNAICWEEKFAFDVFYVDNLSFWLDIKILLLTILKVIRSEGISAEGVATMQKFSGTTKL